MQKEKISLMNKIPQIREEISTILLLVLGFSTFFLAYNHILNPGLMLILLCLHIIIIKATHFDEKKPHPLLHFNRNVEGLILISMFISAFCYFFTWIIDGFDYNFVLRAEICVVYSYLMMFYVLFAGLTPLGLYFAIKSVVLWFPLFLQIDKQFNLPIILYIEVVIISLMSIGTWFTLIKFLHGALMGKESYGLLTDKYKKTAQWWLVITIIFGILLIYLEICFSNIFIESIDVIGLQN